MISNHCEFTFLSFKLLGSVFNSLTVKLEIGHTVACLHFQFDFDFHATISLRAIPDIQTQKFTFYTQTKHTSIFMKSILARNFCIQTIKSQKQIAWEISN